MNHPPRPAPGTGSKGPQAHVNAAYDSTQNQHNLQVPNWPDRCCQCLALNKMNPGETLYCPAEADCPYSQ